MWTMSGREHDSNTSFNPKICDKNVSTDTVTSLLGLNHYHQPGSNISASRWNPTPQQLLALEEIYRLGTRTPTAEEIQQIAQHLRGFGKIEAKNVFYWFQNHKARERLRRRREVELRNCQLQNRDHNQSNEYKKESGLRRTIYRDEQAKNCNFKHSEGFVSNSMHKATPAKRLTNTSTTTTLYSLQSNKRSPFNYKRHNINVEKEIKEVETLELFPLCSSTDAGCGDGTKKDIKVPIRTINTNLSPNQFFEFLPLKN